jgi:hypothetical protein
MAAPKGAGRPTFRPGAPPAQGKHHRPGDRWTQFLDGAGGVEYLEQQADKTPVAFMTLVGKVLPMQVIVLDPAAGHSAAYSRR